MESKLSLKVRKIEKRTQRSISFPESRVQQLESLTKLLNFLNVTEIVNSIVDEYMNNGFVQDEETNQYIPIKLVLEAIESGITSIEELRIYIEDNKNESVE